MFLENITGQTMHVYFLQNKILLSGGGGGGGATHLFYRYVCGMDDPKL